MYKLLVADDNKVGRDAIAYMLHAQAMPFEVFQAKNGQEALQMIRQNRFDCVITDIKMPRLTGIELIKAVNEEGPAPLFVICSGYRDFEDAKAAIEYGVQNYLLKPVAADDFIKTMNQILALLRENDLKEKARSADALRQALQGGAETENPEVSLLLKKTARLIAVRTAGNHPMTGRANIHARIDASAVAKAVGLDKIYDILLYFANGTEQNTLDKFLVDTETIYREFGAEPVSFYVSKQIADKLEIPCRLDETIKWSEKKFFSGSRRVFYAEQEEPESGEELTELEHAIYKQISGSRYAEAKESILAYLDLLSEHNKASALYTKFLISNFIKAILQRYSIQSGSMLLRIVEEIGYTQSVDELKKIIARFIDSLLLENPLSLEEFNAVELAEKIIRTEYAGELTLEQLAGRVYLSPSYLSRAFKRKTGINLFSYLTNIRMEEGKRLLTETNSKISEISQKVGYEDPAYFSKVFKQQYGMIPKIFRIANGMSKPPAKE